MHRPRRCASSARASLEGCQPVLGSKGRSTQAIGWMWLVEHNAPDRWDVLGGLVCLAGSAIILLGPRAA